MPVRRHTLPRPRLDEIERDLVADLELQGGRERTVFGILLESFDGRTFRDGSTLEWRPDPDSERGALHWTGLDLITERGRIPDVPEPPVGSPALPPGPVSARLASLLGERALLPVARLRRRRTTYTRRDRRGKTVLRVWIDRDVELGPAAGGAVRSLPSQIHLEGLRGFDDALERAAGALAGIVPDTEAPVPWAEELLREAGVDPGADPSAVEFRVEATMPAAEGFRHAFSAYLSVIRANSGGTLAALDPEFLHDTRVGIRRTRSLLSAARGIVDEPTRQRFAAEFKWLGGETGRLRDLDVHLLHFDELVGRLEDIDAGTLEPLRILLVEHQRRERQRVAGALGGERARALLDAWEHHLREEDPTVAAGPEAPLPLAHVAAKRIRRAQRRVLELGRRLGPENPDEDFHELRKRAKKLRYLLECFGPVIGKSVVRKRIRALKGLQDNLGQHQDRCVQAAELRAFAAEMEGAPPTTLMAMGFLVERLDEERRASRREFDARFSAFDRAEPRRAFAAALDRAEDRS